MNKLVLALTLMATSAMAAPSNYERAEIDQEIATCVAEVANHADYRGAGQVQHEVVVSKRRAIGHKLDIRTSVYSDAGEELIRAYATRCVVYRDNKPVRFRISELGNQGI